MNKNKCAICGNKIGVFENSLRFKDGQICSTCAKKLGLLNSAGSPTVDGLNYCNTHTIEDFKKLKDSNKSNSILKMEVASAIRCDMCHEKVDPDSNYFKFINNSIMCTNCATKFKMIRNNKHTKDADKYAKNHNIEELKYHLSKFGTFHPDLVAANSDTSSVSITNNTQKSTRRIISGIAMIGIGAICLVQSLALTLANVQYFGAGAPTGCLGILWGIFSVIFGIYNINTTKKPPKHNTEVTSLVLFLFLLFLWNSLYVSRYFPDLSGYMWIITIAYCLGYAYHGSKLYTKMQAAENQEINSQSINTQSTPNNTDYTEIATQLEKYKKLLDDNAISKAEYDEIKARILDGKN